MNLVRCLSIVVCALLLAGPDPASAADPLTPQQKDAV